tara:strand:+ start:11358 stop:12095 length:738 start_codon:yes stop_codon:yes gene_type:complete
LKNWNNCPYYHKLVNVDKIKGFKGNAFTAFGTAIHSVCERKLLQETVNEDYFIQQFESCLQRLDDDVEIDEKLVAQMRVQGKELLPEIQTALDDYFGEYKLIAVELPLMEPIKNQQNYKFKGYIDAIVATPDGKIHIFDWKTCSWGWDARRRAEPMVTYQLTLYKHFYAQRIGADPANIETHFALLKRTAKNNRVEFFRVTSGPRKTENALKLLNTALFNIKNKRHIKNRLSCRNCEFYKTKHCT